MMRIALSLFACLLLAACAARPPLPVAPVTVAPGITLDLPRPAELGRSVEAVQMVSARYGNDSAAFEARLSVTPERLLLVCADGIGRRAITLRYGAAGLEVEKAAWVPDSLRPENILADIMLLYWPEEALSRALKGAALSRRDDGRQVGDAIRVAWQGDPWNGASVLANKAWDYELQVQSVVVAP